MTINDVIHWASQYPEVWLAVFATPPLLALILSWICPKGQGAKSPWPYLFSALTHWVSIPGMLAAVLTGYALFFVRQNLLDVSVMIYFLPIASMFVSLVFISKAVSFQDLPGFERLSALMILLAGTFTILLFIHKMFVGIFFGGSIAQLAALALGLYMLLKWATYSLFRAKHEPKLARPSWLG